MYSQRRTTCLPACTAEQRLFDSSRDQWCQCYSVTILERARRPRYSTSNIMCHSMRLAPTPPRRPRAPSPACATFVTESRGGAIRRDQLTTPSLTPVASQDARRCIHRAQSITAQRRATQPGGQRSGIDANSRRRRVADGASTHPAGQQSASASIAPHAAYSLSNRALCLSQLA